MNDAKLEMKDENGEWFEVGTARDVVLVVDGAAWPWGIVDEAEQVAPVEFGVSGSITVEYVAEDVQRFRDVILVGGGRGDSKSLVRALALQCLANSLDFDMPKLVESAPGSFTGKGRKAHKKFNRKMGGGW